MYDINILFFHQMCKLEQTAKVKGVIISKAGSLS